MNPPGRKPSGPFPATNNAAAAAAASSLPVSATSSSGSLTNAAASLNSSSMTSLSSSSSSSSTFSASTASAAKNLMGLKDDPSPLPAHVSFESPASPAWRTNVPGLSSFALPQGAGYSRTPSSDQSAASMPSATTPAPSSLPSSTSPSGFPGNRARGGFNPLSAGLYSSTFTVPPISQSGPVIPIPITPSPLLMDKKPKGGKLDPGPATAAATTTTTTTTTSTTAATSLPIPPPTSLPSLMSSSTVTFAQMPPQQEAMQMPPKETKKRKARRACLFCQRSHMTCDDERPCQRCQKRGIAHLCSEGKRKQAKYLEDSDEPARQSSQDASTQDSKNASLPSSLSKVIPRSLAPSNTGSLGTNKKLGSPPTPSSFSSVSNMISKPGGEYQPLPPVFVSEAFNQEFSMLSDMVSLNQPFTSDYTSFGLPEMEQSVPHSPTSAPLSVHANFSEDSIYDSVVEPYPYPASFHHMLEYAKQRLDKNQLFRLCQAYVSFRPNFVAAVKTLTRQDLIFVEKCFQRTILDFSKLLTSMGTPTCAWRRSGELALVGQEFTILTQWPTEQLLSKQTFLFELMDNESTVEYWEKYAEMCRLSKNSVLTKCTLIRPDKKPIPCTVCYTIKRDIFDMPLVMVGNFLPILSSNTS